MEAPRASATCPRLTARAPERQSQVSAAASGSAPPGRLLGAGVQTGTNTRALPLAQGRPANQSVSRCCNTNSTTNTPLHQHDSTRSGHLRSHSLGGGETSPQLQAAVQEPLPLQPTDQVSVLWEDRLEKQQGPGE